MSFGPISVLIVEVKLKVANDSERLDAIAQVIAECNGQLPLLELIPTHLWVGPVCNWNNSRGNFVVHVFGILWDGAPFQILKFDGTTKPYSFLRGAFSGDPPNLWKGLKLPHLTPGEPTLPFIQCVCQISETIFDLLLPVCGHIASIKAFHDRFAIRNTKEDTRRESLDEWDDALRSAKGALEFFSGHTKQKSHQQILGMLMQYSSKNFVFRPHSTGFQIWFLPMLFLNSLRNNIFWKNICKGFCSCKSQRNVKFDILHWRKWVPDVSPLRNVKFRVPLTLTAAKVFMNIFSIKYYFTNNLEITLAGAKFWTCWICKLSRIRTDCRANPCHSRATVSCYYSSRLLSLFHYITYIVPLSFPDVSRLTSLAIPFVYNSFPVITYLQ